MARLEHIAGRTFHGRTDGIANRFTYGIDYVLLDAEAPLDGPAIFSRNRANLVSLHDSDHGGAPGKGRGAAWVRDTLAAEGLDHLAHRIELLAQPRVLGHVFNPVSFWLIRDSADALRIVIAEVSNTFGDRHSYLCHRDDLGPIGPDDTIRAPKVFHVSPFQRIAGQYAFTFDITDRRVAIRIAFLDGPGGLVATLTGNRHIATTRRLLGASVRRPLGARRVLGLIHWQALKLWWKGARYRTRPVPPDTEVTGSATKGFSRQANHSSSFELDTKKPM